jgi:hypothetical protein
MKFKTALILWIAAALYSRAAEPYLHSDSGISLPDKIAGLVRGSPQEYKVEPNQSGVAIPFQGDEVEVTVFIRATDPAQAMSPAMIIEESLAAVKELEKAGIYTSVKVFGGEKDPAMPQWSKAAYTARSDQGLLISFIHATVKGRHAVKIRITTTNPKSDAIPTFVSEIQKITNAAKPKG